MHKESINNQLEVPEAARNDANSQEIIRVWIANENQHFTLRAGLWDDPAVWGLLFADLARNIAKSYEQYAEADPRAVLERIKQAFNVELEYPTDH
jgi:hypothetical protein